MGNSELTKYLARLSELTSSKIGQDYFDAVVEFIATSLDVDYAFIGEIIESKTAVKTLSVFANGCITENIEYGLADTPCHDVISNETCFYPSNIQKLYPKDILLQERAWKAIWVPPCIQCLVDQ